MTLAYDGRQTGAKCQLNLATKNVNCYTIEVIYMSSEQTDCPIAKVDFEEAKTLADLGGLTQDLSAIMQTCTRLLDLLREDSKDHILLEALWTSALVRYARCFAEGKRYGLDESVFSGFNGDPVGTHRLYINIRNKHIAHSVNPLEQMEVGLVLASKERHEQKIIGVATLSMRQITADADGVRQLGMLAKVILGKVVELAKHYEQKVLEIGLTLPLDDLYGRARPHLAGTDVDSVGKPRK